MSDFPARFFSVLFALFLAVSHAVSAESTSASATVQNEQPRYPLYLDVRTGLEADYSMKYRHPDSRKKILVFANMTVLNSYEAGFIGRWLVEEIWVDEQKIDESHPLAGELLLSIPLEFEADFNGFPLRFRDHDAVMEAFTKRYLSTTARSSGEIARRRTMVTLNETGFISNLLLPMTLSSSCHNLALPLNQEVTEHFMAPSGFEGAFLEKHATFELSDWDQSTDTAFIEIRTKSDESSALQMLKGVYEKTDLDSLDLPDEVKRELRQINKVSIRDRTQCEVEIRSGRAKNVTHDQFIRIGEGLSTHHQSISVLWRDP